MKVKLPTKVIECECLMVMGITDNKTHETYSSVLGYLFAVPVFEQSKSYDLLLFDKQYLTTLKESSNLLDLSVIKQLNNVPLFIDVVEINDTDVDKLEIITTRFTIIVKLVK